MKYKYITNEVDLKEQLDLTRSAQEKYATFSQNQVDKIFLAASIAANKARIKLARLAVEETGMGVLEDKVIKNHYASEYIYNAYKNSITCGEFESNEHSGVRKYYEPLGLIAAVIPTTNPTSTAIFKALLALKTRNAIVFSPHPRAKKSTIAAAKIILEAAIEAGAPEHIITWIDEPSLVLSQMVMKESDTILATGGPGMVKSAYSSGKPAIGVGAGNVPALIDKSADIKMSVSSILISKTFDNGMICASEQSVLVDKEIYNEVKEEFVLRGAYILKPSEMNALRKVILVNGKLNSKIVGQTACDIARMANITVDKNTKVLIGEVTSVELSEPFAHEKLSPILAMYKTDSFDDALEKSEKLILDGGIGHTASIYINTKSEREKLLSYEQRMKACRIVVNTPSSHGGIGDLYNFKLLPSLTLGCGSWGNNSVSENVGVKHLLNIKTVVERRENMLWFRAPSKVYFKRGSVDVALHELKDTLNKKRAFIVTDNYLYESKMIDCVTSKLKELNIEYSIFFNVEPDPTLGCANEGAKLMQEFKPDVIIAFGGGSPIDAAKIMWTLYEHPNSKFEDLAMRFMDIRKRISPFPKLGSKAYFIAIPTTAGTGSEVTPFAVITDEKTGSKYPLADYELMPNMAIIDANLMMNMPKELTAASGIDALTHAFEAIASVLSSEYTNALAKEAIINIFKYLPRAYKDGANDEEAREKMANAATLAGMAFANAFLGVGHSMAHKLGAYHKIPHGVANALMLKQVIRFNSAENPVKIAAFSQYKYPQIQERYVEIARILGIDGGENEKTIGLLIDALEGLNAKLGISKSIKDYGIKEVEFLDKLDAMALEAFDDQCTGANPRYPLIEEIKQMYLNAYYGK